MTPEQFKIITRQLSVIIFSLALIAGHLILGPILDEVAR